MAVSSPSGGGKTTVIERLLEDRSLPFVYSISMTTRPKRPGEIDGRNYWFVDSETFRKKIEDGELVEYQNVHGYMYGTPKRPIETWIDEGKIVLLDIDVYGAQNLRKHFPHNSLLIFLKPPDLEALRQRLKGRATESPQQIQKRLERVPKEMAMMDRFDAVVVNDRLEETVRKVRKLIEEKLKEI